MVATTTLGIDAQAVQRQITNSSSSASNGFDSFLSTTSYAASVFGPVATESVYASSGAQPASIVSAAVNAAADPYGTSSGLYATTGSYGSSSLGSSGSTNYLTGGTSYSTTGFDSTSVSTDPADLLAQMQSDSTQNIAMQAAVSNMGNQVMILTNVLKAKTDADRSIIQNVRS